MDFSQVLKLLLGTEITAKFIKGEVQFSQRSEDMMETIRVLGIACVLI